MHRFSYGSAISASLCLAACSSLGDSSTTGRTGDLGHGTFSYQCVDPQQDTACAGAAAPSSFPPAVAVHGRFKLAYHASSADPASVGNPTIEPVSKEFLVRLVDELQAIKPGTVNVVVRSSADSKVIDFTPIHISPVSALQIVDPTSNARDAGATPLTVRAGATISLLARAYDPRGEPLAGLIGATWTSGDAKIAQVQSSTTPAAGALGAVTAVAAGSTTITATTEDNLTASIAIMVTP